MPPYSLSRRILFARSLATYPGSAYKARWWPASRVLPGCSATSSSAGHSGLMVVRQGLGLRLLCFCLEFRDFKLWLLGAYG